MVMKVFEKLVLSTLPAIPRPIMRRLSARYIAGEELEDALAKVRELGSQGYGAILDILGEDVTGEAEARSVLAGYKGCASAVKKEGLDCYVSVKPTHFGLRTSKTLALELYTDLLAHCRDLGQFARVEMEDHTTTDDTLELFAELRREFDNVGIVLQSRLLRTPEDIEALPPGTDVRMVKGIYLEPAEIAYTEANKIRDAYLEGALRLLESGHKVALATHDDVLADRALKAFAQRDIPKERYYFEVLLGVQQKLWSRWRDAGQRVLIYVPYGPQWRAYSQRRLKKNPEILRHVMANLFRS